MVCESTVENSQVLGDLSSTLLANILNKIFGGAVIVEIEETNLVLTLRESVETIDNIEDFQREVLAVMKTLEESVSVRLLQLTDDETFDIAIRHFLPVIRNNPTIKLYGTGNRFSFYIAFQRKSDKDKDLVDNHTAVIKNQKIIEEEKHIALSDYCKIKAEKSRLESLNALVTIEKIPISVRGFQEDVNAASYHINRVLQTSACVTKRLDDFAIQLLNNPEVCSEVEETLARAKLKVWWEVAGLLINVVGKNVRQATEAAELIESYFNTRKISIPDYLLDSTEWKNTKDFAFVNSRKHPDCTRLLIDDVSERPMVIIKGTTSECDKFTDIAKEFRSRYMRVSEKKKLTREKCEFVLKYLRAGTESQNTNDFLKIHPSSDKAIVMAVGTSSAQRKFDSRLSEISTQKYWIYDDSAADRLKILSESKDCGWNGTVHIFENNTKICFKTGRIEEQKVRKNNSLSSVLTIIYHIFFSQSSSSNLYQTTCQCLII